MNYDHLLFIDTETTGIPVYDGPVDASYQPHMASLAALLASRQSGGDYGYVGYFYSLIKPDRWTIPSNATQINGITADDLFAHGIELFTALSIVREFCDKRPLVVAHNLRFDAAMIKIECYRCGIPSLLDGLDGFCTMCESTNLCQIPRRGSPGEYKWPTLAQAYRKLCRRRMKSQHNALSDALACAELFFVISSVRSSAAAHIT